MQKQTGSGGEISLCSADCKFQPMVVQHNESGSAELTCIIHGVRIGGGAIYESSEIGVMATIEVPPTSAPHGNILCSQALNIRMWPSEKR